MTAERIFDWSGRIGLLAAPSAWGMLALGIGGPIAFVALASAFLGSMFFVWYQVRLRALGKAYPDGKDLLLSCTLSLIAMFSVPVLALTHFAVLVGAH
jgi:hypothetical protein